MPAALWTMPAWRLAPWVSGRAAYTCRWVHPAGSLSTLPARAGCGSQALRVCPRGGRDVHLRLIPSSAGGSSLRWVKETLCRDIMDEPDVYDRMSLLAASSPLGANGILFNPSLAGGTSQDKSINIRGAFLNLHLGTGREDLDPRRDGRQSRSTCARLYSTCRNIRS